MQIHRRRTSARPSRSNLFALCFVTALAATGLLPSTGQAQDPTEVTSIVNSEQDTTLEVNHSGGLLMPGKFADPFNYSARNDSIPAEGAGTRLLWYPEKAAFRAGRVSGVQWDADNIGRYSVAFNRGTKARGFDAMATGRFTTASGDQATAMGDNTTASGSAATAIGEGTTASGDDATAMGFGTTASINGATAMGGRTTASAIYATSMGSNTTASGGVATAMGQYAEAAHDNTFVWADGSNSSSDKFSSGDSPNMSGVTGAQTFHVKATGGARFVTGGGTTYISGSSAGWSNTSTRSAKTDVSTVDPVQVLKAVQSMPISTWEYKDDSGEGEGVRHMGPIAEDFHGEVPYELGSSENHINSINADGVALAAIKGLTRKVGRQQETIDSLRNRVQQTETLEKRVARLEAQSRGSVLAGLPGSWLWGGALLLFLLGGSLATLLQRSRQ